jgi:predicted metal-dependent hydrolase
MFGALKKTYADMAPVVSYMLEVDGYAKRLDSRARRLMVRLETIVELGPVMFHYLAPGYHPSKEAEPPEFAAWLHRQEGVANGAIADESAER